MKAIVLIYGLLAAAAWWLLIWYMVMYEDHNNAGVLIALLSATLMTISWFLMNWAYNERQKTNKQIGHDKISSYMNGHIHATRQYEEWLDAKEQHDVAMAENQAERYPE